MVVNEAYTRRNLASLGIPTGLHDGIVARKPAAEDVVQHVLDAAADNLILTLEADLGAELSEGDFDILGMARSQAIVLLNYAYKTGYKSNTVG